MHIFNGKSILMFIRPAPAFFSYAVHLHAVTPEPACGSALVFHSVSVQAFYAAYPTIKIYLAQIIDYKFITLAHSHFGWNRPTNSLIPISKIRVQLRNRF
jgi:hypothetical protein